MIWAVLETEPSVPVITGTTRDETATVLTVNVPVEAPAANLTVVGTVAWDLLLLSLTVNPPFGAGPVRVAVPVEVAPPVTELGLSVTEVRLAGSMVTPAFWEIESKVPVIVAVISDATTEVVTGNVAED